MKRRRLPYIKNPVMVLIGAILVCSTVFMLVSNLTGKKLDVYNNSDRVSQEEFTEEAEEETTIAATKYTDTENGFSVEIPDEWERIEKQDGTVSFIHRASSSSVEIQISDYDPDINNADASTLSQEVVNNGMTYVSFEKVSSSCYELVYQDYQTSIYDYMDVAYWNLEKSVHLLCCFNDENYDKILPYYQVILESFAWEESDAVISSDYMVYYADALYFQFGYPISWTTGESESAFSAYDETTASNMTVTFEASDSDFTTITGVDVATKLNNDYDSFIMNSYENTDTEAHAVCTYTQNGTEYTRNAYLYANGTYLFYVIFDYQAGMLDDSVITECTGLVRIFEAPEEEDSTSTETENTVNTEELTDTTENTETSTETTTEETMQSTEETEE